MVRFKQGPKKVDEDTIGTRFLLCQKQPVHTNSAAADVTLVL